MTLALSGDASYISIGNCDTEIEVEGAGFDTEPNRVARPGGLQPVQSDLYQGTKYERFNRHRAGLVVLPLRGVRWMVGIRAAE